MMSKKLFTTTVIATNLILASAAFAQAPTEPPLFPAPSENGSVNIDGEGWAPALNFMERSLGVSKEEARMRLTVQNDVIDMLAPGGIIDDPDFSDLYIQQEPVFKIIISFKGKKKNFITTLDPSIRQYFIVKNVKRNAAEITEAKEVISNIASELEVLIRVTRNKRNGKFIISVADRGVQNAIRKKLPKSLKPDVKFKIDQVLSGGEESVVRGGSSLFAPAKSIEFEQPDCTVAYPVSFDSGRKLGFTTAGHCFREDMYLYVNGTWPQVGDFENTTEDGFKRQPTDRSGSPFDTDPVDYAVVNLGNLPVFLEPLIYFRDLEAIPEFPDVGFLGILNTISTLQQKEGMVVCKSGVTTGITCGKIINDDFYDDNTFGWKLVGESRQSRLTRPGDSGSPWFTFPDASFNVRAAGIHSSNPDSSRRTINNLGPCFGTECIARYMAIDFIQTVDPTVTILTIQ